MPKTVVRLSAGRLDLTESDQAMAFLAGANSIFDGDKLLTTPNNDRWGRRLGARRLGGLVA
jgi:biotin synthase